MIKGNTNPGIAGIIVLSTMAWRPNTPLPYISQSNQGFVTFHQKTVLGWGKLMEGFFTPTWAWLQKKYFIKIQSK